MRRVFEPFFSPQNRRMLRGRHSTGRTLCQSLALAITGAGAAVFRAIAEADGNVAVSPASLEIALTMAAAGATQESRTFQELCSVLGHDEIGNEAVVHASMKKTLTQLLGRSSRKRIIVRHGLQSASSRSSPIAAKMSSMQTSSRCRAQSSSTRG